LKADPGHAAAITEYVQGQISTGQFPHLSKLARDRPRKPSPIPAR
jgi:hypothetical protein